MSSSLEVGHLYRLDARRQAFGVWGGSVFIGVQWEFGTPTLSHESRRQGDLIARIRELYPAPAPKQSVTAPASVPPTVQPPPAKKTTAKGRGVPDPPQRKKKRPKSKSTQEYCPKCHAFDVMTRLEGVTTVADHQTKKGERCAQSGKPYTPKPLLKPDALDHRVAGSFGTGKRT